MTNARRIVRNNNLPLSPPKQEPEVTTATVEQLPLGKEVDEIPSEVPQAEVVPVPAPPELKPAIVLGPAIAEPIPEPPAPELPHTPSPVSVPEFSEEELKQTGDSLKPKVEEVVKTESPKPIVKREMFPPLPKAFRYWE